MRGTCPAARPPTGASASPILVAKNLFEVAPVGTRVIVRDGDWNIHEASEKASAGDFQNGA